MSKRTSAFIAIITAFTLLTFSPARSAEPEWQSGLKNSSTPLAKKLLEWFEVTETDTPPFSTAELIRFSLENSGWPKLHAFREQIEKDIGRTAHPAGIAAWFDQNPPRSANGLRAYIRALHDLDMNDKAKAALNKFWLSTDLDRNETSALARQYGNIFSPSAHAARLNNLLWEQRYQEAEYMLPLVGANPRMIAEARIALGRMSSKAPRKVSAIPASLQNDSGLLYDRLRWRREMNKDADAFELLRRMPKNPPHAELWWRERGILGRRAMEKKNYALAYKITLSHGLTSGADYSQAEWLLGWLSLRFLHQPDTAYHHFENFYQAVTFAVSRSRGAYWLARADEALHQDEGARNWDKIAAQFPSTFYGQLSYEKLNGAIDAAQFPDDEVPPVRLQEFKDRELVQVINLLAELDLQKYTDIFFIKLLDSAKDRPDFVMTARLARETDQLYFAVEANKQLQQKLGEFMFTEGYPLLPPLTVKKPESALIHAIVHRESMFDAAAASPAGARGLMQLMPHTAKMISRNIREKFTVGKLTENPQYNIELGADYLQHLLNSYDGFYPLAIAAYNAGPSNVNLWMREFGDPRRKKIDIVDWIELIPTYETRNYVQRVMESYYLYKLKMAEKPRTVTGF